MKEHRNGASWLLFILLSLTILGGAWLYTNWQSSRKVLPPGLTLNAVPMGGMTREQAVDAIALAYTAPITVYYANEVIILLPEMVELSLDVAATERNLDEALLAQSHIQNFVDYVLAQLLNHEPEMLDVRAIANYSRERVDAFLARVAQKHDHPPQNPVPLPDAGTFRPARMGTSLDISASRPLLIKAILAATLETRAVVLLVDTEPAPEAAINLLQDALQARLNDFSGAAGLFIKHMGGGMELCLNCDVAFSGLSTLKIALLVEVYRLSEAGPDATMLHTIRTMLSEEGYAATNTLLTQLGAGDAMRGASQVTELLRTLGLQSTFLAAPYDPPAGSLAPDIITPANSRLDIITNPDPFVQTTPVEIALLLEGVYQCAHGGGFLRVLYPHALTPAECEDMLNVLGENDHHPLLQATMPASAQMAHQHGWDDASHAEVALVSGPAGNFIITLFIYQPEWTTWEESEPLFATIGSLSYRFFNGDE